MSAQSEFLTTKELPEITGFSTSYFNKGRLLGYGPRFMRFKSGGRTGKILYRRIDVESWMADMTCDPKGGADV
ncbi:helix-turn-helix transcriptional regulator [Roseobacter sp. EG26]|uniref:helix-turn-helix transcriptional regulator n=1 Tax=Roseobacter sp. EG26 TaxID=3412477 RepID=UPI003CE5C51E